MLRCQLLALVIGLASLVGQLQGQHSGRQLLDNDVSFTEDQLMEQYRKDPYQAQKYINEFRRKFGNQLEPVAVRKDPLDDLNEYQGGYNITDEHYLATAVWAGGWPLVVACAVIAVSLITLLVRCCCCCCGKGFCPGPPDEKLRRRHLVRTLILVTVLLAFFGIVMVYVGGGWGFHEVNQLYDQISESAEITSERFNQTQKSLDQMDQYYSGDDLSSLTTQFSDIGDTVNKVVVDLESYRDDVKDATDTASLIMIIVAAVIAVFLILVLIGACCKVRCLMILAEFLLPVLSTLAFMAAGASLITWYLVDDSCKELGNYFRDPSQSSLNEYFNVTDIKEKDLTGKLQLFQQKTAEQVEEQNQSNLKYLGIAASVLGEEQVPLMCVPFDENSNWRATDCPFPEQDNSVELGQFEKKYSMYVCSEGNISALADAYNSPSGSVTDAFTTLLSNLDKLQDVKNCVDNAQFIPQAVFDAAVNITKVGQVFKDASDNLYSLTELQPFYVPVVSVVEFHCPNIDRLFKTATAGYVVLGAATFLLFFLLLAALATMGQKRKQQFASSNGASRV